QLGQFTLDNASNCDTLMEWLESYLQKEGIPFDRIGNRIWYLDSYAQALNSDPVGQTQGIVGVCRASGGRRKELKCAIEDGNKSNTWGEIIRVVQLLRDCETRWSSTYNMIDRTMELYPPIQNFLQQPSMAEHTHRLFTSKQYEVLGHIHQILQIPHWAQELLAAEKTPTLAMALPVYEKLVELWKSLALAIPEMSHYIGLGVAKIMEYVSKGRRNKIYALAMILNPRTKFQWMEQQWELKECVAAEIWLEEAVRISNSSSYR
ncbi:hypothetical protein EDB89DRAFT_1862690, partial [Lactarius sanguifluus]